MAATLVAPAVTPPGGATPSRGGRRRRTRFIVPVAVIAVAAAGVVGLREATGHATKTRSALVAPTHPVKPTTSPAIEAAWGIRFTNAIVEADGGIIELRYTVLDAARAEKIHAGITQTQTGTDAGSVTGVVKAINLPIVIVEATGAEVKPDSVLFHFSHGPTETAGRTYSIVYGNSGGAVRPGAKITIRMADGLKLEHLVATD